MNLLVFVLTALVLAWLIGVVNYVPKSLWMSLLKFNSKLSLDETNKKGESNKSVLLLGNPFSETQQEFNLRKIKIANRYSSNRSSVSFTNITKKKLRRFTAFPQKRLNLKISNSRADDNFSYKTYENYTALISRNLIDKMAMSQSKLTFHRSVINLTKDTQRKKVSQKSHDEKSSTNTKTVPLVNDSMEYHSKENSNTSHKIKFKDKPIIFLRLLYEKYKLLLGKEETGLKKRKRSAEVEKNASSSNVSALLKTTLNENKTDDLLPSLELGPEEVSVKTNNDSLDDHKKLDHSLSSFVEDQEINDGDKENKADSRGQHSSKHNDTVPETALENNFVTPVSLKNHQDNKHNPDDKQQSMEELKSPHKNAENETDKSSLAEFRRVLDTDKMDIDEMVELDDSFVRLKDSRQNDNMLHVNKKGFDGSIMLDSNIFDEVVNMEEKIETENQKDVDFITMSDSINYVEVVTGVNEGGTQHLATDGQDHTDIPLFLNPDIHYDEADENDDAEVYINGNFDTAPIANMQEVVDLKTVQVKQSTGKNIGKKQNHQDIKESLVDTGYSEGNSKNVNIKDSVLNNPIEFRKIDDDVRNHFNMEVKSTSDKTPSNRMSSEFKGVIEKNAITSIVESSSVVRKNPDGAHQLSVHDSSEDETPAKSNPNVSGMDLDKAVYGGNSSNASKDDMIDLLEERRISDVEKEENILDINGFRKEKNTNSEFDNATERDTFFTSKEDSMASTNQEQHKIQSMVIEEADDKTATENERTKSNLQDSNRNQVESSVLEYRNFGKVHRADEDDDNAGDALNQGEKNSRNHDTYVMLPVKNGESNKFNLLLTEPPDDDDRKPANVDKNDDVDESQKDYFDVIEDFSEDDYEESDDEEETTEEVDEEDISDIADKVPEAFADYEEEDLFEEIDDFSEEEEESYDWTEIEPVMGLKDTTESQYVYDSSGKIKDVGKDNTEVFVEDTTGVKGDFPRENAQAYLIELPENPSNSKFPDPHDEHKNDSENQPQKFKEDSKKSSNEEDYYLEVDENRDMQDEVDNRSLDDDEEDLVSHNKIEVLNHNEAVETSLEEDKSELNGKTGLERRLFESSNDALKPASVSPRFTPRIKDNEPIAFEYRHYHQKPDYKQDLPEKKMVTPSELQVDTSRLQMMIPNITPKPLFLKQQALESKELNEKDSSLLKTHLTSEEHVTSYFKPEHSAHIMPYRQTIHMTNVSMKDFKMAVNNSKDQAQSPSIMNFRLKEMPVEVDPNVNEYQPHENLPTPDPIAVLISMKDYFDEYGARDEAINDPASAPSSDGSQSDNIGLQVPRQYNRDYNKIQDETLAKNAQQNSFQPVNKKRKLPESVMHVYDFAGDGHPSSIFDPNASAKGYLIPSSILNNTASRDQNQYLDYNQDGNTGAKGDLIPGGILNDTASRGQNQYLDYNQDGNTGRLKEFSNGYKGESLTPHDTKMVQSEGLSKVVLLDSFSEEAEQPDVDAVALSQELSNLNEKEPEILTTFQENFFEGVAVTGPGFFFTKSDQLQSIDNYAEKPMLYSSQNDAVSSYSNSAKSNNSNTEFLDQESNSLGVNIFDEESQSKHETKNFLNPVQKVTVDGNDDAYAVHHTKYVSGEKVVIDDIIGPNLPRHKHGKTKGNNFDAKSQSKHRTKNFLNPVQKVTVDGNDDAYAVHHTKYVSGEKVVIDDIIGPNLPRHKHKKTKHAHPKMMNANDDEPKDMDSNNNALMKDIHKATTKDAHKPKNMKVKNFDGHKKTTKIRFFSTAFPRDQDMGPNYQAFSDAYKFSTKKDHVENAADDAHKPKNINVKNFDGHKKTTKILFSTDDYNAVHDVGPEIVDKDLKSTKKDHNENAVDDNEDPTDDMRVENFEEMSPDMDSPGNYPLSVNANGNHGLLAKNNFSTSELTNTTQTSNGDDIIKSPDGHERNRNMVRAFDVGTSINSTENSIHPAKNESFTSRYQLTTNSIDLDNKVQEPSNFEELEDPSEEIPGNVQQDYQDIMEKQLEFNEGFMKDNLDAEIEDHPVPVEDQYKPNPVEDLSIPPEDQELQQKPKPIEDLGIPPEDQELQNEPKPIEDLGIPPENQELQQTPNPIEDLGIPPADQELQQTPNPIEDLGIPPADQELPQKPNPIADLGIPPADQELPKKPNPIADLGIPPEDQELQNKPKPIEDLGIPPENQELQQTPNPIEDLGIPPADQELPQNPNPIADLGIPSADQELQQKPKPIEDLGIPPDPLSIGEEIDILATNGSSSLSRILSIEKSLFMLSNCANVTDRVVCFLHRPRVKVNHWPKQILAQKVTAVDVNPLLQLRTKHLKKKKNQRPKKKKPVTAKTNFITPWPRIRFLKPFRVSKSYKDTVAIQPNREYHLMFRNKFSTTKAPQNYFDDRHNFLGVLQWA